jgi:hypothetical protein
MTDQEIYKKFIEWMNNPVMEFTESEMMMPMITSYITPEEAEFLTGFPFNSKSLNKLELGDFNRFCPLRWVDIGRII